MSLQYPDDRNAVFQRMLTDYQSNLPTSNPFLRNSWLRSFIASVAGRVFEVYIFLQRLTGEFFPQSATAEFLERWGTVKGITRNPASQATGLITFTGTAGASIPSGTVLVSSSGVKYETDASVAIGNNALSVSLSFAGGVVTAETVSNHLLTSGVSVTIAGANESEYNGTFEITVTGLKTFTYEIVGSPASPASGTITASFTTASVSITSVDFGNDTNQVANSSLTLQTPIASVDSTALVQFSEVAGGFDLESDDDLRTRILDAWQNPTTLFNVQAITEQAKLVSGVTRVWVQEVTPYPGAVTVYFTRDNDVSPIPSASEVQAVKNSILTIKPATTDDADVIVSAPTPVTANFVFSAISPDTTNMRNAIGVSLAQFFAENTEVGESVTELEYECAILSTVDTETGKRLQSFTLSAPVGDITINAGEIALLGNITYS